MDTTTYRLLIVEPTSRYLLALASTDGYQLPEVTVPMWSRQAPELRKACLTQWGLQIFVVSFLAFQQEREIRYAITELIGSCTNTVFKMVSPDRITNLSGVNNTETAVLLNGPADPLSRLCWFDEAIAWVESATESSLSSRADVEQLHAGAGFSLVRFRMEDGRTYWLKATGIPNLHEYDITQFLSDRDRSSSTAEYLPRLIATRKDWNAWLMDGEAQPLPEIPHGGPEALLMLNDAVVSLARLQIAALPSVGALLQLGAFDQRSARLLPDAAELFDFLRIAMSHQTSTKVPRIEGSRLVELRQAFETAAHRIEDLDLPMSLVHGDLNGGNILRLNHCLFIDWAEAYVGNPLVSLQHLLLLNRVGDEAARQGLNEILCALYREEWRDVCDPTKIDIGFRYMPLLAAVSSLYGRGDWLHAADRLSSIRLTYARTLARQMDRAARQLERADI